MILSPREVRDLYGRNAAWYDLALIPYRLLGLRARRRQAVEELGLRSGDTVVDLCCGTGANLRFLHDVVGPGGRIVGVDLTGAMLERARRRAEKHGLRNVELVEADVVEYVVPPETDGVLSTFGLEMVPEYDRVIRAAAAVLPEGRRLVLLGLKHPHGWPNWLVELGVRLNRPFGVSRDYARFRPCQSLRNHVEEVLHREFLFGAAYLSVGQVPIRETPP